MVNKKKLINNNLLIILPHLDDEFAFAPLIHNLSKKKYKIFLIFCAERLVSNSLNKKSLNRRNESIKSIHILGINLKNVVYLNDHFIVDDRKLHLSAKNISNFITKFIKEKKINKILTTSFEGGHPDHDSLALIVDKCKINKMFIPIYNSRKSLFLIPFSVMRPTKKQEHFFKTVAVGYLSWFSSLKIAFVYKSEFKAMIKLLPFILFKCIFSSKIYFTDQVSLEYINYKKSLTYKRYNTDIDQLISKIFP